MSEINSTNVFSLPIGAPLLDLSGAEVAHLEGVSEQSVRVRYAEDGHLQDFPLDGVVWQDGRLTLITGRDTPAAPQADAVEEADEESFPASDPPAY